jgi:hypothetical protein
MSECAPSRSRRTKTAPTSSIHFRMPSTLRSRLRRFAEERNLGEAEALRLAVSERLNQIDDERELAEAERWQFEQAYGTFQRYLAGKEKLVGREQIDRTFERALRRRQRGRGVKK